ncbi:N acetylglucosamine 6 phosphate [Trichuris trichiura]|uniref:N-acetylglucosamine-6-phosphate deacetylase n=1 Tax=Trichuris trichiura TaxID=36087 RepID=A0A077ZFC4_TRITR|nr:N acetylglucosamine 6 phosphate [Trichuris trichiura]
MKCLKWYDDEVVDLGESLVRFINCQLLVDDIFVEQDLWVHNGRVIESFDVFYEEKVDADYCIDCEHLLLAPSFIDLQVKGSSDINLSSDDGDIIEKLRLISRRLLKYGVTSFCPTIMSSSPSFYQKILKEYNRYCASDENAAAILGFHMEGPFISSIKRGCHKRENVLDEFTNGYESIERVYGKHTDDIRMITLAPELPNALEVIKELSERNILVSLGYSNATVTVAHKAVRMGARGITHIFNAMKTFHDDDMGVAGLLMGPRRSSIYYGLIADGFNCEPAAVKTAYRLCPRGLMLVTNEAAASYPEGGTVSSTDECDPREKEINLRMTPVSGFVPMVESVRSLVRYSGCDCAYALSCASLHPAKFLGIDTVKGSLKPGCDADFLLLSDELNIVATFIDGRRVYKY